MSTYLSIYLPIQAFPIAANAMAVVALQHLSEMLQILNESSASQRANKLSQDISSGIGKYGTMQHPTYGQIYAYEVIYLLYFHIS